ncbi:MAG: hypothetical protein EOS79_11485 [Mesorhizobium sp.]|nr:MAG: hypothetical protein EOS79_11485 [Mesorhizobium sp.]
MPDIEKIEAELRAGLEGVTPGPWHAVQMATNKPDIDRPFVVGPSEVVVGTDGICEPARFNDRLFPEDAANMRHIARCDPDTIRLLLDELSRLRGAEKRYREALERASVAAYSEPHYLGSEGFERGADGLLPPGSPYDRGRYDARKAVEAVARRVLQEGEE